MNNYEVRRKYVLFRIASPWRALNISLSTWAEYFIEESTISPRSVICFSWGRTNSAPDLLGTSKTGAAPWLSWRSWNLATSSAWLNCQSMVVTDPPKAKRYVLRRPDQLKIFCEQIAPRRYELKQDKNESLWGSSANQCLKFKKITLIRIVEERFHKKDAKLLGVWWTLRA